MTNFLHTTLGETMSVFRNASPWVRARAAGAVLTRPVGEVVAKVPVGASVLDFGAGDGLFAALLADKGCRVTALEPDAARRRTAGRILAGRGVRFFAQIDDLPRGETFDVILAVDVFYLVPREQRAAAAGRLARFKRQGGRAVIKEVIATRDWMEALVAAQERAVNLLVADDVNRPIEWPSAAELDDLAASFGPVTESTDLPVAWYRHRLVVAGT